MTPSIALLFCAIFVFFLLRLDRKQFPEASPALWIPALWMLVIASRGLNFWIGTNIEELEEGSAADRIFQGVIFCFGVLILAKRQFKWSSAIRQNPWVFLLVGYMLTSVLWSDIPFISFRRWLRELVALVTVLLVATEQEPRRALEAVIRRTVYILIPVSLLLIHFYPNLGVIHLRSGEVWWQGVADLKNGLGRLCFFSLFFLIWSLFRRWRGKDTAAVWYQTHVEVVILMITLYLFMGPDHTLTYSATSTAVLAVGLAAFAGLLWMRKRGKIIAARTLTLIVTGVLFGTLITPFLGRLPIDDVSSILDRSETVTGRADKWAEFVPAAMENPLLGRGFGGAAWHRNPHNSPITIILNLGFAGFFFFAMFFLSSCRRARLEMAQNFDWGALWACMLIMSVLHGIAERSMVQFGAHLPAVLLFFYFSHNGASYRQDIEGRNRGFRGGVTG